MDNASLDVNQLKTKEESLVSNSDTQQNAGGLSNFTVEQLQEMEMAQHIRNRNKISPTQPVTPAVVAALYAGDNQEKPVVSRDKTGEISSNILNLAYQKGPAKPYVTPAGELEVEGRREALAKTAPKMLGKINDYAEVVYPEFLKDFSGRSGKFKMGVGMLGTAAMALPEGVIGLPASAANAMLSAGIYIDESKWQSYYNTLDERTKRNIGFFIKTQMEEAAKAKAALTENGDEEYGDGMYADAQERIFSMQTQRDFGLSPHEMQAINDHFRPIIESRDAFMRRSLFVKMLGEDLFKEGKESLYDVLDLTENDRNSVAMQLADAAGKVSGNLAFMYGAARAVGSAVTVASDMAKAVKGGGFLNYARKARAAGATVLASDAAVTAGMASRIAFQEASIIPMVFAAQFNDIRTESLLAGKSLSEATNIGLVAGAVESGLEFAGFKIFKRFYTKGGWMRNVMLRNVLPEGLQEASQTAMENLITEVYGVTDKQWTDVMSEIGFSLLAGMAGGAAFSAGRMRLEGMMAGFEETASKYTHSLALLTSEKARQAYGMAMDELAFEEWLESHPEVDSRTIEQKRAERAASKEREQELDNDVKRAKEDIKTMYKELKDYYTAKVKKVNPDVKKKQLNAGWDLVKKQLGVALDGNTLVAKYYAAADHVIDIFHKRLPQIDKYQVKQIRQMLDASGKYTKAQIKNLTSKNHIEATNAKLQLLETNLTDNLINQGVSEVEAKLSARATIKMIAPSALVNTKFDAVAMSRKLRTNVLHIKNAIFHKMEGLKGTPYEPITSKLNVPQEMFDVSYLHDRIISVSKLLFSGSQTSDSESRRLNILLYGDENVDPGLKRTRELLRSQAPLTREVIKDMPTKLNREISDEEAGALWLLNRMGFSWADIFKQAGIEMRGNRNADKYFNLSAQEVVAKPKAKDMDSMRRLSNRIKEMSQAPQTKSNAIMGPKEQAPERMGEAAGLYDPQENLIILNNPNPGTAFHEHNHFSIYAVLNNGLRLDEAGLLPDTSLLAVMKEKLAKNMKGARWLTEREFQETLNDALFQYLESGQCKDPVFTSYFALLKSQNYESRVDLYASRLSKKSASYLDEGQQEGLQKAVGEVFGASNISDIIMQANKVRQHALLEGLPDKKENESASVYHSNLANSLADELQTLLNMVPVEDADEFSRQIELARNEDFGAPVTQDVFVPGQKETTQKTAYNKGNITKLLVLGEQISAQALDFAYDILTTDVSSSQLATRLQEPLYDLAVDVKSPVRDKVATTTKEITESLKSFTPSWEVLQAVGDGIVNALKDLMYSLEATSGEVANELRDLIMREVWNEASYRNLFRAQLRPVIEAKDAWISQYSGTERLAKQKEFNRQVTANLGDGNFKAARDWMAKNFGEDVAKAWDNVVSILIGDKAKAETWMRLSPEERKNNPLGYLYKGATGILAEAGVSVKAINNFFPMLVRDFKGLTKNRFGHAYTYSEIDKVKARLLESYLQKTKNVDENGRAQLTVEERDAYELEVAELVNSRMQRNVTDQDKVSSFFERRFRNYGKTLDAEAELGQDVSILDYYYDPFEALDRYMDAVLRTATMRHLIGHTVQMKNGEFVFPPTIKEEVERVRNDVSLSAEQKTARINEIAAMNGRVGLYLAYHDFRGDPKVLNRFMKSLHAYANRTAADPDDFFNWIRGVNQLTMLGSIFSTLNQFNDLQYCFSIFGYKPTFDAIQEVFFNHDSSEVIKLEDVGGETSSEAFRPSDETPLYKATKKVFKKTGFEWADTRLKEVTINAFNNYMRDMSNKVLSESGFSPEEYARFDMILDEVIPDMTQNLHTLSDKEKEALQDRQDAKKKQIIQDLAAGKQTQDIKYLQWYMLCKMQPMNAATVSSHYNSTGSFGRLCWQFNTVMSRQVGFLKEMAMKIYNRHLDDTGSKKLAALEAGKFLAKFVLAAYLIGIPKELLESLLKGQKPEALDLASVPLQAVWVNIYTLGVMKRDGLMPALVSNFMPKSGALNNLTKDVYGVATFNFKGYASRNIPVVGPFIWHWILGGRTAAIKQDKALFHHKMTAEEYEAKMAKARQNAEYMKTGKEQ